MAMLRPLLHFLFLIDANFVSAASRNLWELMSLPSSHKSSASSSPPENFGQGRRLIVEETLRQHQHRRKLLSCYKTELRELPPRQQPGARKCCCDDGSCASDPECSMDPLVPAKFHAPVIELNVHPSDEGIKAEGASAVATIDANVNTVRGEEPRSPESAAAAAAAAAATTTTTTTTPRLTSQQLHHGPETESRRGRNHRPRAPPHLFLRNSYFASSKRSASFQA